MTTARTFVARPIDSHIEKEYIRHGIKRQIFPFVQTPVLKRYFSEDVFCDDNELCYIEVDDGPGRTQDGFLERFVEYR